MSAKPPSEAEKIAEVIAHLDVFERDLASMASKVREYRHILFETLDKCDDELVD